MRRVSMVFQGFEYARVTQDSEYAHGEFSINMPMESLVLYLHDMPEQA